MTVHDRTLELAAAAIDWELTPDERDEMAAHLAGCTACRHAEAVQRHQTTALREHTHAEIPASVRGVVLAAAVPGAARSRQPAWSLLAAAALIALAGLGGVMMVGSYLQDRERAPTSVDGRTDPQPTPDTAPIASIAPERAVAELARLEWATTPAGASTFDGATISGVVAGPSGLVAVGQASPTLETLVFVSRDGRTWESIPQPPDVFGGGVPTHIVTGGPGLVAIGWDISVENGTRRAVWTSPNGRAWTRDPDPSGQFGIVDIIGVASADGVILVLASETSSGGSFTLRSTDGLEWARSTAPDGLAPGVSGLAKGVVGFVVFGPVDNVGTLWSSPDGQTWTAATSGGSDPSGITIERVVGSGTGLLAQGRTESDDDVLLASADGRTWRTVATTGMATDDATVANGNGAFLAYLAPATPDAPVVAWTSANGVLWTPLANSPSEWETPATGPAVTVTQATPFGDEWVVFGYETGTGRPLIWAIR